MNKAKTSLVLPCLFGMLATFSSGSFATSTSSSSSSQGTSTASQMSLVVVGDPESTYLICLKYAYKFSYGTTVSPKHCPKENWPTGCGYSKSCNPPLSHSIPRPAGDKSYSLEMVISDNPTDPCYNASTWVHITCTVTSSSCPDGVCKITATEQNSYNGDNYVNAHSIGFGSSTGLSCSRTSGDFFGYTAPNPKGIIECES